MTTIKFFGGGLGSDVFFARCNLAQAAAPVEQSGDGIEWGDSQYQCADCRHTTRGLVEIAKGLAARAVEVPPAEFDCDWEEID